MVGTIRRRIEKLRAGVFALTCLAIVGCDEPTEPTGELNLEIVAGAGQVGGYGLRLRQPVTVRVRNAQGLPAREVEVSWHVTAGGGGIAHVRTRTDSAGVTTNEWTLGADAGTQLLVAQAGNASIAIPASAQFQFLTVSAGFGHTCALSSIGQAYCWGRNDSGQLGDGTESSRANPALVHTQIRFKSISAGWGHTCGLSVGGAAFCWGDNRDGQLATGNEFLRRHAPTQVAGSTSFDAISAGYAHTCAIGVDSAAYCWGNNSRGQLGNSSEQSRNTPTRVDGATRFKTISVGEFHSCGVATDQAVFCWGSNSTGELGANVPYGDTRTTPTRVVLNHPFAQVAAGARHTCAIGTAVFCWGRNGRGENGLTPPSPTAVPVQVHVPESLTHVGGGNVLSCGASSGSVFCWGSDGLNSSIQPQVRFGGSDVSALGTGFEHVCVVSAGDIYCWGGNSHGQLGRPANAGSAVPVKLNRPE